MTSIKYLTVDIQNGKPINLTECIQAKEVAIRSVSFTRGWYNIKAQ